MKSGRRIVFTFPVILALVSVVHADMMPVSQEKEVRLESQKSYAQTDLRYGDSSDLLNPPLMAGQYQWQVEFLPKVDADIEQSSQSQHLQSLTNEPNSLRFCLSALVSLGLCCWAPWVKRLSLGFIPDWYHEGGPFQIGHSTALMPGTLCPAPACCFIQPVMEYNHIPRYHIKTVLSIMRKSQSTSEVFASRGPPRFF